MAVCALRGIAVKLKMTSNKNVNIVLLFIMNHLKGEMGKASIIDDDLTALLL